MGLPEIFVGEDTRFFSFCAWRCCSSSSVAQSQDPQSARSEPHRRHRPRSKLRSLNRLNPTPCRLPEDEVSAWELATPMDEEVPRIGTVPYIPDATVGCLSYSGASWTYSTGTRFSFDRPTMYATSTCVSIREGTFRLGSEACVSSFSSSK